jgi:hypothetical protein
MWRHGDVLIAPIAAIPERARSRPSPVLAYGEITGHSHRIADPEAAEFFELDGIIFMKVMAESTTVVHEEHKPITLPRGTYRVWQQREYTPQEIRRVVD